MRRLKGSLTFRIAAPAVILILALGAALHGLMHKTLSEFACEQIERDLNALSHRLYSICNTGFEDLIQAGLIDDAASVIVKKALTLGQFEDLFRQERLSGLIYSTENSEILLDADLPAPPEIIKKQCRKHGILISMHGKANGYFGYCFDFSPWNWEIIIIKSEREYHGLISKVRNVHFYTFFLLIFVSVFLVYFIRRTIRKPIDSIIKPLQEGKHPNYHGIEVFEYLSGVISDMMESIRRNEEKYRSLVETTSDFVWEADEKGTFTYASPTIEDILGYQPEELAGKKSFEFMRPADAEYFRFKFHELRSEKKPFERIETTYVHKDGHIVILESNGVPVLDSSNRLLGYRGIDRDITGRLRAEKERKKLEGRLQQLQKLEAIGTLAGGIAHDFNNLLSVIMGNISLAEAKTTQDIGKYLAEAEKASIRAQELTQRLITFATGAAPALKAVSIGKIVMKTISLAVSGSYITCEYHIPNDLWKVEADTVKIKQALKNLAINAMEAASESIFVWAENIELNTETEMRDLPITSGKYVKIGIQDQGAGITRENLPLIFDPYFSTKKIGTQKGMGLGLAITFSIISRHDGHITVESAPGRGTTFIIYLPAYEKRPGEHPHDTPPDERAAHTPTRKALLMDDEEMIRNIGGEILKKIGYKAKLAEDGAEAVSLYKSALERGEPFDFVILDLKVKDGMGGKEAIRKLKEIDPNVKGVVSSGFSNDPVMTEYQKYGFIGALPKPYALKDLQAVLNMRA